jgi:N-formylmaleamate deformylase
MSHKDTAPAPVAVSRHIRLRAGPFHYRCWVSDTDGPPVVLLHGNGDTSATWCRVGAALCSGGMRVFAPDLRGCGASVRPPVGSYGLGDVAADLRELIATLALHRPVLVGHCWGAAVALRCATGASGDDGPPELAGLVLEELPTDMASTVDQPAVRDHLRLLRSSREYAEGWVRLVCRSWHPADRASFVESVCSADEEVYLSVVDDGAAAGPLLPLLARLEVPALVLRGGRDRGSIIGDVDWRRMQRLLPANAVAHDVAGCGHDLHRGDFATFVRLVEHFVHMQV